MKILQIHENDAEQRLDKFLKKLLRNANLSYIYKLNRTSKIKVSNPSGTFNKRENEYKLEVGQKIKLFMSDGEFNELTKQKKSPYPPSGTFPQGRKKLEKKDIEYEDEDLLVINKNPGINVHPGDHKSDEVSVIEIVQDYLGDTHNSFTFKPSLIHRIDRDTSGALMIAKKKQILTQLTNDLKTHKKIKKNYYAICLGKLPQSSGTITKKLLRVENAKDTDKVKVSEKGLSAITYYKLIAQHKLKTKSGLETLSELEIQIETGRMHQIRVHMADLGCPILGDKTYGNKRFNGYISKHLGLTRQALHAWKIEFFHYSQNKQMKVTTKIKEDLVEFIKAI